MITIILLINILISQEWTVYNKDNSGLVSNNIQDVLLDNEDNLWLINSLNDIYKIKDNIWSRFNSENTGIEEFDFWSLSLGQNNVIYAGQSPDSKAWICKFENNKWVEIPKHNADFYGSLSVDDLIELENGDIWIATGFGACYLNQGQWYYYLRNEEGRDSRGIFEFKNNIYFIGKSYLYKLNYSKDEFEYFEEAKDKNTAGRLTKGPNNNLYFASSKSNEMLVRYDGTNWFDFNLGTLDSNIRTLKYANNGKFYLQTRKSVYEIIEENKIIKLFTVPDSIMKLSNHILVLEDVDSKNNFWFTIFNEGLIKCSLVPNNVRKAIEISIYPNPTRSKITVNSDQQITELALYTTNLTKAQDYIAKHTTSQEINISNLSSGIYFIKVNDDFIKFVKE